MLYLDKIICLILSDNVKVKNKYVAKKQNPTLQQSRILFQYF